MDAKQNKIHYAYGLGGSVSIELDKKKRRRKPKDTTAMLSSQGGSAAFIQSLWSLNQCWYTMDGWIDYY